MPFLKLTTNVPVLFKLAYDSPYEPKPHPEYGQQYNYKFATPLEDGADTWGATELGHELMRALKLKKGDTVELIREKFGDKGGQQFRINGYTLHDLNSGQPAQTPTDSPQSSAAITPKLRAWIDKVIKFKNDAQFDLEAIKHRLDKLEASPKIESTPDEEDDVPF